jgi:hypothetical protein
MAMKEIADTGSGEKFKFENKGDTIEGFYLGSGSITINGKPVVKHSFQKADGTVVSPLGNYKLDELLSKVTVGAWTKVEYTGLQKLKAGKTLKGFRVASDDERMVGTRTQSLEDKIAGIKNQAKGA